MRKVKNAQVIQRLSAKSFQASRTRNRIAAFAIALTAILFTAVFTIVLGMVESVEYSNMLQAGGDMHGSIKRLTEEQYEKIRQHPDIKESVCDMSVAWKVENPEFLKRHLEMHYVESGGYAHWFVDILEGRAPETADEILMDKKSMELLGVKPKSGESVTLKMLVHQNDTDLVERTFTVSGVIRSSEAMNVGFCFVSDAYLEKYASELQQTEEYDDTGVRNMGVLFSNSRNIQEKLNRVITESGYSVDAESPDCISSNANWGYLSDGIMSDPVTMAGMFGALLLIFVTGYLIIYNIFQISVRNDIQYYGLLKTIGTTGRQIRRILRRQAFRLCLLGLPAGLLIGFFAGKLLLPAVVAVGKTGGTDIVVSPKPWIFAGASLFTICTVLLSEWKPGRIASKVSPVEALHGAGEGKTRKKQKKSVRGGRIGRMAFSNLGRNKGRTALVICSLSLTVVLLNSVYTVTASFDREGVLSKMILSEGLIGNAKLWNYNYRPYDEATAEECSLSRQFVSACEQQEGFLEGGRIYAAPFGVSMSLENWNVPDYFEKDEYGMPGFWREGYFINFVQYNPDGTVYSTDMPVVYHGIGSFVLSKMTVIEGETDKDKIMEKLQAGNYLIYAADVDDDNQVIKELQKHHAGEKVILDFETGGTRQSKEYEILSVIKRHQYSLTNRMGNNFEYYVSEQEFKEHFSESFLMNYLFDVKEGYEDEMEEFLKNYTTSVEPSMNYETRETYAGMANQMLGTIAVVGTSLAGVIGLIGILNFINTILTAIVTRKREFATMEAIGMTKKQLVGMLTAEGLCYAGLSVLASAAVSILFSVTALRGICNGVWLLQYRFTVMPALLVGALLLLMGACVPKVVYTLSARLSGQC